MKSGGYLVIEPTEALTVIDVNTGKYDKKKPCQETFRLTNWEAAAEVARQLRLRNLSGIVVVDFINMAGSIAAAGIPNMAQLASGDATAVSKPTRQPYLYAPMRVKK